MSALLQAIRLTGQNVTGDVKLLIAVKDSDVKAACRLLASGANANAVGVSPFSRVKLLGALQQRPRADFLHTGRRTVGPRYTMPATYHTPVSPKSSCSSARRSTRKVYAPRATPVPGSGTGPDSCNLVHRPVA